LIHNDPAVRRWTTLAFESDERGLVNRQMALRAWCSGCR
jgi:hypothetical protein